MRTAIRLAVPALAATTLAASAPQEGLAWGPSEGAVVTKTFELDASYDLEDLSLIVAGQDIGEFIGTPEMTFTSLSRVVLVDEYEGVGEGRPTKLTRTFDELENTYTMFVAVADESDDQEGDTTSDLEGRTVVFTWDPEAEEYRVTYPDEEESDDELLDGLVEDTDLRGLLPKGSVSEGDSWTFEAKALEALLMPSGDLAWMPEDMGDVDAEEFQQLMESMLDGFDDLVEELLEGERTATFSGMREVDGVEYAVVDLAVSIDSAVDLTPLLERMVEEALALADGAPRDASVWIDVAEVALDVDAEGQLLWNAAAGLPKALTMSGDVGISFELVASATFDREEFEFDMAADLSGIVDAQVGYER